MGGHPPCCLSSGTRWWSWIPTAAARPRTGPVPLGLRGSTLNLESALWAARFLRGAGARVFLTREDEVPLTDPEKIRLAQ